MSTATKLPDKLSDLIDVALTDLEACEADPRYKIDMCSWHMPGMPGEPCHVCLAGAVLAKTVGLKPYQHTREAREAGISPSILDAIDALRLGCVWRACQSFGLPAPPPELEIINVTSYHLYPAQFKADMRRLAATLREHGL